jgi:hypothetical protein
MEDSQDIAWGSPLKQVGSEFVIPKTLGEAIQAEKPYVKDLSELKDYANESYAIIAQFAALHHNLGLALNKIASITNKTSQLIEKYK